ERIRNLMNERGHPELLMNVDDPDLEARTLAAIEILDRDVERIADGIARSVELGGLFAADERRLEAIGGGIRVGGAFREPSCPRLKKCGTHKRPVQRSESPRVRLQS